MHLRSLSLFPYAFPLLTGRIRSGFFLRLVDEQGNIGWGEIAPLPGHSQETENMALEQLRQKKELLFAIAWYPHHCLETLEPLELYPSVSFGLESALLSLLSPLETTPVALSAFFTGSVQEILRQAEQRFEEGYIFAKLKVNTLSPPEALTLINALSGRFRLRIDVNRAWPAEKSLPFFAQFPKEAFDYVEEPLKEIALLPHFPLPLAIDESFPHLMACAELETLPTLKALVYKPTLQGGLTKYLPLHRWAKSRGISLVLGSSFESDLGLRAIAAMAHRLSLVEGILLPPVGIGTVHCLPHLFCKAPFPHPSPPNAALLSTHPIIYCDRPKSVNLL